MQKARKIALIVAVVLASLLLITWISVRVYLHSNHANQQVGEKLGAVLGAPVTVEDLSVGASSVSFRMQLFEPAGGTTDAPPLLTVERIEADVTPLQLLSENVTPRHITLRGAKLHLTFDRDGKLLTRLPEPGGDSPSHGFPDLTLEKASVVLSRVGHPDFQLTGVSGTLRADGERTVLNGTTDDAVWGKWTIKGEWNPTDGSLTANLENPGLQVTTAQLKTLAFVPDSTWEQVQTDGIMRVRVNLVRPAGGEVSYKVVVNSTGATVHVGSIDLTTTDTVGEMVLEGSRIDLKGLRGNTAGGELKVDAILDFARETARLQFKVSGQQLNIRRLPKSWSLPQELEGDLNGKAELELLLHDDKIDARGQGEGLLENAVVAGFPADPIEFKLRPAGEGFKFDTNMKSSRRPDPERPFLGELNLLLQLSRVALVTLQPPIFGPEKPATETPYVDARLRLKDVDVKELFTRLKIDLPLQLAARASADITLSIPVTAARTPAAYRARGTLSAPRVTVEGLELDDVVAELTLRDGVLTLDKFQARPRTAQGKPGEIAGTARVEIEPRGALQATFKMVDVPVDAALNGIPGLQIRGGGRVSGNATFRAPVEQVTDPARWQGTATLRSEQMELAGRKIADLRLDARVDKGKAELVTGTGKVEGVQITLSGSLGLTDPWRYAGQMQTTTESPVALRRLLPELDIPVAVSGKINSDSTVKGTLAPFTLVAGGTARLADARLAEAKVEKAAFRWDLDDQRLRLTNVEMSLYEGTIGGRADIPVADRAKGDFQVDFKSIDATALLKVIPDAPVTLEGAVSGKLTGTIPAVEKGQPRQARADLQLDAPKLRLQGIPTERVSGKLHYTPRAIEYELKGDALGGGFELEGKYPLGTTPTPATPKQGTQHFNQPLPFLNDVISLPAAAVFEEFTVQAEPALGGSFRLSGVELARLARALGSSFLEPLRGRVDAVLNYTHEETRGLSGSGRVSVRQLAWGGASLAPELTGVLRLNDTLLELTDVSGTLAGGGVRGRVRYNRAQPQRSFFQVVVERADPARLLAPWPELATVLTGSTSVQLQGQIGRAWRGTGSIALARGTISGLDAADLRVPFNWAFSPGRGGQLSVREPSGRFVGGQVTGHATYEWWPGGSRTEGDLQFRGLDLRALEVSQLTGRVKGRFTFQGTDLRSTSDLTGVLTATLGDFSPQPTALLQRLKPHLGTGQSLTPFRSGEIRARLARDVFRVERLELISNGAQIFAEGTVTLAGRLDLRVLANTGQVGPDERIIRLLARQIPAVGGVPVTVLKEVSDFMSNRLIRLNVTGTVEQPVVRVNKAALLTDEAARFFTQRVREQALTPLDLVLP